jgi:cytoskeletal protein CcmA (bactofilin family)
MGIEQKPPPLESDRRGLSTGAKFVLGCGLLLLLGVLAACGGIAYLGWWGWSQVDAVAQEFTAQGYQRQMGQVINVPGPVDEPTVYVGQMVYVNGEVNADVAFVAQMVEVNGQVNGDIDFNGQMLHIKPGAVVKGDIRVKAGQAIIIEGIVEGKISGNYQSLQDRRTTATPPVEEATKTEETAPAP